jgi:hypothetical protein
LHRKKTGNPAKTFAKRPQKCPKIGLHALKPQKIKFIGDKTSVRRGQKNTYEAGRNCGKIHFAAPEPGRREKEKQHSNIALGVLPERIANVMPAGLRAAGYDPAVSASRPAPPEQQPRMMRSCLQPTPNIKR